MEACLGSHARLWAVAVMACEGPGGVGSCCSNGGGGCGDCGGGGGGYERDFNT